MKRRQFLHTTIPTLLMGSTFKGITLPQKQVHPSFDQYGGWKNKKFKATGFFRTEKDHRWWLVTPDGHAFLSFGINHLHANWWKQDFNREAWMKNLGATSFDGAPFNTALRSWFLNTCKEYGFNSVGVHNDLKVINTPSPSLPYVQPIQFLNVPHWRTEVPDENFKDVFAADFESHCDQLAKEIAAPLKDDPFLLGYAMTDCPLFTEEDCRARTDVIGGARRKARIGWPRRLRNLGPQAPGKQVYVQEMKAIYHDNIQTFNATYQTNFDSFDSLAIAQQWRLETDLGNPNETRDNHFFLHRVVEKYYQTALDAIRRYDPNHLFIGDKLNANTDSMDTVLPVTSRFTDVLFYQMYGRYEVQLPRLNRWSTKVDQPIINGDSAFTMITEHMPRPYGPIADDLEQRVAWTTEFFQQAFARPEFVGWHYCGLIDADNQIPSKVARQHSGLMDGFGKPYPLLQKNLKACVDQMYKWAAEK